MLMSKTACKKTLNSSEGGDQTYFFYYSKTRKATETCRKEDNTVKAPARAGNQPAGKTGGYTSFPGIHSK